MWKTGSDRKCCGNCANWDGPRKKDISKGWIETDLSSRGKCYCGHNTSSNGNGPSSCPCMVNNISDWQLWSALR